MFTRCVGALCGDAVGSDIDSVPSGLPARTEDISSRPDKESLRVLADETHNVTRPFRSARGPALVRLAGGV